MKKVKLFLIAELLITFGIFFGCKNSNQNVNNSNVNINSNTNEQDTINKVTGVTETLVAILNGKKIYSNKKVISISNNKITFSDVSYCTVENGAIVTVNKGSGYINNSD